jgi:hypothetical protein
VTVGSAVICATAWSVVTRAGADMAPLPIAAQVSAVLAPATGVSALALAAVTRPPVVMLPETAADWASPLAPLPIAVADAVPALDPPLPPVAVALEVIEAVESMASLVAVALPPAAPLPPAPPVAVIVAVTLDALDVPVKVSEAVPAPPAPPVVELLPPAPP